MSVAVRTILSELRRSIFRRSPHCCLFKLRPYVLRRHGF